MQLAWIQCTGQWHRGWSLSLSMHLKDYVLLDHGCYQHRPNGLYCDSKPLACIRSSRQYWHWRFQCASDHFGKTSYKQPSQKTGTQILFCER